MIRPAPISRLIAAPFRVQLMVAGSPRIIAKASCRSSLTLSRIAQLRPAKSFHTTIKRKNTDPHERHFLFPERLLIFHAGTGRTTFLATLKMTTIFVFGFFVFVVTPAYFVAPDMPISRTIAMAGCGIIPFAFVAYSTAPLVTYIHIRLPFYARHTKEGLEKWLGAGVHRDTDLEISSMTLLARPKQTSVSVGDIMPTQSQLGVANYKLIPGAKSRPGPLLRRGGKWWQSEPLKQFNIQGFNREAREGWVWEEIARQIERRAKLKGYTKES